MSRVATRPFYADGSVTLYHGDCLDVLERLDPDDFGVLLTDPPYGIDYESGRESVVLARLIANDEDTAYREAVLDWWGDRPALIFGSWKVERPDDTRMLLVWDTGGALGMGDLSLPWKPAHQEIYVLGSGFTGRRTTDVLSFPPVQSMAKNGRLHPHQKPLSLLRYLLGKCPPGPVLDPFAGSGSTLRAAKDVGRQAVGVEVDAGYCRTAADRLAQGVLDLGGAA